MFVQHAAARLRSDELETERPDGAATAQCCDLAKPCKRGVHEDCGRVPGRMKPPQPHVCLIAVHLDVDVFGTCQTLVPAQRGQRLAEVLRQQCRGRDNIELEETGRLGQAQPKVGRRACRLDSAPERKVLVSAKPDAIVPGCSRRTADAAQHLREIDARPLENAHDEGRDGKEILLHRASPIVEANDGDSLAGRTRFRSCRSRVEPWSECPEWSQICPAAAPAVWEATILRLGLFLPTGFSVMSFAPIAAFEAANIVAGERFYDLRILSE